MAEAEEISKNFAISKMVEANFSNLKQKLDKQNMVVAKKILELEQRVETTEVEAEINELSAESSNCRKELLRNLVRASKVSEVIERNKARQAYMQTEAKIEGYDLGLNVPSKKEIEQIVNGENYDVSLDNLGLGATSVKFLNYKGNIFYLSDGKIDCTGPDNLYQLKMLTADDIEKIIAKYPEIITSISGEALLDSDLRVKLLKAIASYSFGELRNSSVEELNKKLGEPITLKRKYISSFESYISGIKNLFQVKVKKYLLNKNPDAAQEIEKLPCNEHSPLLPDALYEVEQKEIGQIQEVNSIEKEIDEFLKNLAEDNS